MSHKILRDCAVPNYEKCTAEPPTLKTAVWTFWTLPLVAAEYSPWRSTRFWLLSWLASVHTAKQWFPQTSLVTDSLGKAILIDQLGLDIPNIDLRLDALSPSLAPWWMLGKLEAYRAQMKPYFHLDFDVFLWKNPLEIMGDAELFVQNIDPVNFTLGAALPPKFWLDEMASRGVLMPAGWEEGAAAHYQEMLDVGVLGVRDFSLIAEYSSNLLEWIVKNENLWKPLTPLIKHNVIIFEQFYLAAFWAQRRPDSPVKGLFGSHAELKDPIFAEKVGYTHLFTKAKQDPDILRDLEKWAQSVIPDQYARCIAAEPEVDFLIATVKEKNKWQ